jgi:signal transduction histidine kinase
MPQKPKKIQRIFIIYWILLAYIIAALIFWFITLNNQNEEMNELRKLSITNTDIHAEEALEKIEDAKQRKIKQYVGEGSTFLLVIMAGAIFVFRAVRRQLKISHEQQNFMIAITHELKTPLSVVQLNLETIQKRNLDKDQQQRLLHNTLHETNRLNSLCNNMLLSSQIEAGGYSMVEDEINLGQLAQSCVDDFVMRYPQRHITSEIEEGIFVKGDPFLLQISVNNLLENALKYSPKETEVITRVSRYQSLAQIEVQDNGPGIEDEYKKKVFEKFYRLGNEATKRAKGTGLGLYLTKKIVETLGGNIFIKNNIAGGSNFTVQLKADA